MIDITPQQAQALLEDTTPAPWVYDSDYECIETADGSTVVLCNTDLAVSWGANPDTDGSLAAQAPTMAKQIAEMRWEYVIQQAPPDKEIWVTFMNRAAWSPEALQGDLREMQERFPEYRHRIARRLVGKPEEIS